MKDFKFEKDFILTISLNGIIYTIQLSKKITRLEFKYD